jgi:hypothetical protein
VEYDRGAEHPRQAAVELLQECGIHAVCAMEPAARKNWEGAVAAVSLNKVVCAPGGFRDYLGLRDNPDTGLEDELYGRAVEITLGLDLYAPRSGGESACREAADGMTEALATRGVGGLTVLEVEAGRVEFLERDGLYRLPVHCTCRGWLVAAVDSSGAFVDFEVKGRRT